MADRPPAHDVLIVSTDVILVDDLLRLAAAVGRTALTVSTLAEARAGWQAARLVLIGADVAVVPMPQRDRVVMVGYDGAATSTVWRSAHELHAHHVAVLPDAESWLLEQLDEVDAHRRALVVAVVGGRGGAGASALAVALACTAGASSSALLIDGDPLGGGLDLAIGCESMAGLRWRDLAERSGRLPAAMLTESLPQCHHVRVLSYDRAADPAVTPSAASAVLEAARRTFDVVVVDVPRTGSAVADVALSVAAAVVVITPRDVRSVAACAAVLAALPGGTAPYLVTRAPAPGGLAVSDVANILGYPVVTDIEFDKHLAGQLERGVAPGLHGRSPLGRAAQSIFAAIKSPAPHQVAA